MWLELLEGLLFELKLVMLTPPILSAFFNVLLAVMAATASTAMTTPTMMRVVL